MNIRHLFFSSAHLHINLAVKVISNAGKSLVLHMWDARPTYGGRDFFRA